VTFRYHFGGIAITSDEPFPRLRPAEPDSVARSHLQVTRKFEPAPAEETCVFAFVGRFGMRLGTAGDDWRIRIPEGAVVLSRDGRKANLHIEGADETFYKDIFCRRVLPRIAKLHGAATYHAGSLVRSGRGVLLMGHSGAGKSSMTVGLGLAADWRVLGDDMAFVWDGDGRWLIEPAGADVAIWPQSSSGFGLPASELTPLRGYDGKHSVTIDRLGTVAPGEAPLQAVFFVERVDCPAPEATPLPRPQALKLALEQMVRFDPSNQGGAAEWGQSVTRLNTMLGQVPAFMLRYPPGYGCYDAISAVIEAALDRRSTA
jgi:hypothetical protein